MSFISNLINLKKNSNTIFDLNNYNLTELPLYEIQLSDIKLSFRIPSDQSNKKNKPKHIADDRPFINIKTQSEYHFYPGMLSGSYTFYNNSWPVFNSHQEKQEADTLNLSLTLLTPTDNDRKLYPDLLNIKQAEAWLQQYYTYQNEIKNNIHFDLHPNGGILIDAGELPKTHEDIIEDDDPIVFTETTISSHQTLIPKIKPSTHYYCIPITCRDILVFCFSLSRNTTLTSKLKGEDKSFTSNTTSEFITDIVNSIKLK